MDVGPQRKYDKSSYQSPMASTKIAITIDAKLLERLDRAVREQGFPNRSRAVQDAVRDKLDRLDHRRLARECAKLDCNAEQQLAEEGLAEDFRAWPAY